MDRAKPALLCPSAQPDMEEARVFGVVAGTPDQRRVAYLKKEAAVDADLIAGIGSLKPTQVFRYAARCEESKCAQFADGCCTLGKRIAERLAPVVDDLPSCQIRSGCRWFAEIGGAACLRCPQVVTTVPEGQPELAGVALPEA